jgi:hypothetical protein
MMSVVKFPLAIVVLHRVEKGELALNETYHLTPDDLDAHTWSPMQKRHPNGGTFSLAELLRYACARVITMLATTSLSWWEALGLCSIFLQLGTESTFRFASLVRRLR